LPDELTIEPCQRDAPCELACGRPPETGRDLCPQPTVSRWENAPSLREVVRLMRAMVDLYCASYPKPPAAVTLDIDDTLDVVHGRQQLSLFNAHHDERCFLPIHVYDTATSRPVAVLLRPGKTPSGQEVRGHLRRLVRQLRRHWPRTHIALRGDGHHGRPEVMAFCEAEGIDYVFGLSTNAVPRNLVEEAADDLRVRRRAEAPAPVLRRYAETRYQAGSWSHERRVAARIEAGGMGLDIRFVVTSFSRGSAEWIYDGLYCARGQAGNLVKSHKTRLASDRSGACPKPCRSPLANQVRLPLHTAAYWLLLLTLRGRIPKPHELAGAEFTTLRLHLLKVAGRVIETASRVRIAFAAACPHAALFRGLAHSLSPAGP
jgi:hypothetical protein